MGEAGELLAGEERLPSVDRHEVAREVRAGVAHQERDQVRQLLVLAESARGEAPRGRRTTSPRPRGLPAPPPPAPPPPGGWRLPPRPGPSRRWASRPRIHPPRGPGRPLPAAALAGGRPPPPEPRPRPGARP